MVRLPSAKATEKPPSTRGVHRLSHAEGGGGIGRDLGAGGGGDLRPRTAVIAQHPVRAGGETVPGAAVVDDQDAAARPHQL
jgi:hypothetical protein